VEAFVGGLEGQAKQGVFGLHAIASPIYPLLQALFPEQLITTGQLGRAMIQARPTRRPEADAGGCRDASLFSNFLVAFRKRPDRILLQTRALLLEPLPHRPQIEARAGRLVFDYRIYTAR